MPKTSSKTKKTSLKTPEKLGLIAKYRQRKLLKLEAKEKQAKINDKLEKQAELLKQKAKETAIKEEATRSVEKAVETAQKRRRSHPLLILLLMLATIGLSGAFVWQYRQDEITTKEGQISELNQEIASFQQEKAAIEASKQAEAAKYVNTEVFNASFDLPAEWTTKPTQLPQEEIVYGDENVTFRFINSQTRNSSEQFIPEVNYIWQVQPVGGGVEITSQSLNCERFDTLSNDLNDSRREHLGFIVYCNKDSSKIKIAVLANPDNYGLEGSNLYFLVEVNDLQAIDFAELVKVVNSYKSL